jgi:predicted helicase
MNLDDAIEHVRIMYKSEREKGDMFERIVRYYLANAPEWRAVMDNVVKWADAPTNDGADTGIDIVARDIVDSGTKPKYWAVQCKCYDVRHKNTFEELATFFAKAEADDRYDHMMIVTASEDVSENLQAHADATGTAIVTLPMMREANIDWSGLFGKFSERRTYDLREHQVRAIKNINAEFAGADRCKFISACGSGKTLTSERLAESRCPAGGTILFCAPSIALVGQAMRVWVNQARMTLRPLVVCSDAKASKIDDDEILDTVADLAYPSTTDPEVLASRFRAVSAPGVMTAVFCTYQSMGVVEAAQRKGGLPEFDLIVCDEAHRTTGVKDETMSDADVSAFQIVLDGRRILGKKRLFMTATPRIYSDVAQRKAAEDDYTLASMDDEAVYGRTAEELTFAEAVEKGLLTDYKVIVLAVSEDKVPATVQRFAQEGGELPMSDAAKIIGCYKALALHGAAYASDDSPFIVDTADDGGDEAEARTRPVAPLQRAVGFCATIRDSKRIDRFFERVVDEYAAGTGDDLGLDCELDHVDGTMNSKERNRRLEWLQQDASVEGGRPVCRILTNARCLAEGVDVPSLDAVIFFAPRKSEVDVVQAVGRVMRKLEGKEFGYIILPVFVPAGMTPEETLGSSQTFDVVWKVLQALRSHDQRIEAFVNSIPFRDKKARRARARSADGRGGSSIGRPAREKSEEVPEGVQGQLDLDFDRDDWETAIYSKMVERCGTRIYWDTWADDVARIAERHIERITRVIHEDAEAGEEFARFLKGLRDSLNPGISEADAVEMVAQHMITMPVFEALFGGSEAVSRNPVSVAIDRVLEALRPHGIDDMDEGDRRELEDLYSSVRRRAKVMTTDMGRQQLIKDLYENFFSKAFKSTSEKLGIVYTPGEIVSYILHSTDRALRREFGKRLCDPGVHILDGFAGTGTFMAQLVEDEGLMPKERLRDKYLHELHSNEILLLAYYIMTVNIEYAYHERMGGEYEPFPGAVLTDTFQMSEDGDTIDPEVFGENTGRALEELGTPITVIVGNPPYSAGQKNANDDNQNEHYPTLDARIEATYAANTSATNKNSLYDSYLRAFRWASDRIGNEGIVCFVSNAGWLRSEAGAGVRRCLSEEFSSVYVFDLLGNQRTQGEESRRQGGKVFGSGSRAPIAITMLVKNPGSEEHGAIRYHCVGEYMSREEKLSAVSACIDRDPEWETLTQDRHGDWLDKRDESWYEHAPMGLGKMKRPMGIWGIWSSGLKTQRDPWCWNYSAGEAAGNVARLVNATNEEIARASGDVGALTFDPSRYSWTRAMTNYARKETAIPYDAGNVVVGMYRPFCKQRLYYEPHLNERVYQQQKLFPIVRPNETAKNVVIDVGERGPFIANILPDLELNHHGQCFPLYWYEREDSADSLFDGNGFALAGEQLSLASGEAARRKPRYVRHDAITDETLRVFRGAYPHAFPQRRERQGGTELTKEDVFYYVYGVLHSPEYRRRFAANLAKELPRIPLAREFASFSVAGRALADLHLHYETADRWPVTESQVLDDPGRVTKMKWAKRRDPETGKRVDDHTTLVYNESVTITGIPESAQSYVVNGRSAVDWLIDRYQVRTDKATGITNDPNEYSGNPRYIIDLVERVITVAMRTNEIVAGLPALDEIERPLDWPAAWRTEG